MSSIQPLGNMPSTSNTASETSSRGGRVMGATANEASLSAPSVEKLNKQGSVAENTTLTVEEISETVEALNDMMRSIERGINFRVDDDNGRTVIKIMDKQTSELIKQIPSEDILRLINSMQNMQSLLFEERA